MINYRSSQSRAFGGDHDDRGGRNDRGNRDYDDRGGRSDRGNRDYDDRGGRSDRGNRDYDDRGGRNDRGNRDQNYQRRGVGEGRGYFKTERNEVRDSQERESGSALDRVFRDDRSSTRYNAKSDYVPRRPNDRQQGDNASRENSFGRSRDDRDIDQIVVPHQRKGVGGKRNV